MLALPDFTQPFMLKCNALRIGIGAILMQGHHPTTFESLKVRYYEQHYSIYDK